MRFIKGRERWFVAAAATGLLVAQLLSWAPQATGVTVAPGEPVDGLRGFATGMTAHIGAINTGDLSLADAEVAWSGASMDADANGLAGTKVAEVNRQWQDDRGGKMTFARGAGLELGIGTAPIDPAQLQLTGLAEADAPPPSSATESIEVPLDPVAFASVAEGVAVANSNESGLVPDVCVLGDDLSRGTAHAAGVDLLDLGDNDNPDGSLDAPLITLSDTDAEGQVRDVSDSRSRMRLVPVGGNQFGLMAEVKQTVAPITLVADQPIGDTELRVLTIEVLGEYTLRAVATGGSGSRVELLEPPGNPVVRILGASALGEEVDELLSVDLSDLFGPGGLQLIPGLEDVLSISIGEPPRAIAAPGAEPDTESEPTVTPNKAEGALDIVRVRVLNAALPGGLADIRAGHMEVSAEVPDDGITCPIPVTKTADPTDIFIAPTEPDTSHIELTVHNVFDCDLVNTVLTDRIRTIEGSPQFRLLNPDPDPASPDIPDGGLLVTDGAEDVVWNLGTIPKGTTKVVSIDLQTVDSGGILEDIATAEGTFANCVGEDASGFAINDLDLTGFSIPVQVRIELPRTGADALRTVAMGGGLALAASSLGLFLRRRSRRAA